MNEIKRDDRARGAIALSLTRAAIPRGGVLRVPSESAITPSLERTITRHIVDRHAWSPSLDPTAIGGWIFHVAAIVEVQDQNIYAFAESTLNVVLPEETIESRVAFLELVQGLSRATTP